MRYMRAKRVKNTPISHLFSKLIVAWCVLCGTVASFYALRIMNNTGHDPAALLGVVLAFFGGELMVLCLKTILKDKSRPTQNEGETSGE